MPSAALWLADCLPWLPALESPCPFFAPPCPPMHLCSPSVPVYAPLCPSTPLHAPLSSMPLCAPPSLAQTALSPPCLKLSEGRQLRPDPASFTRVSEESAPRFGTPCRVRLHGVFVNLSCLSYVCCVYAICMLLSCCYVDNVVFGETVPCMP